jgi:hypothetical protein
VAHHANDLDSRHAGQQASETQINRLKKVLSIMLPSNVLKIE